MMRKIVLLLLFLLPSLVLFAQQKIVITGKVSSPTSDMVGLSFYPNPVSPDEVLKETVLTKDNTFRFELDADKPFTVDLVYDEDVATLYLEPGYELDISFKAKNMMKTLKFKGKGANENNYLSQYGFKFDENEAYQVLPDNIYLREWAYNEFVDFRKNDQMKFYQKFVAKNPVSQSFKNLALAEINYAYANDKLVYQNLREYIVLSEPRLQLKQNYYDFLKTTRIDNPEAYLSPQYRSFLRLYLEHLTDQENLKKNDATYYKRSYELAKDNFKDERLQLILARIINESLRNGPLRYSEQMLADFKSLNPKKEYVQFLDKVYNEFKYFAIGSRAPDFELEDINGNKVKLSDFAGKVVYLSFWSTSCGLCMIDQPYTQHLTEKLKGENVVFLNIAVDDDVKAWRQMVTKKKLDGIHVIAPATDSELLQKYQVKDVPAYFLIGEDGSFISRKPKRPSHNEAFNEIQAAVNK